MLESQVADRRFENLNCLILKITHRCNLDCRYCYESIANMPHSDMPQDVLQTVVRIALANSRRPVVGFIFHGGEPTLLPISWLEAAFAFIREQAAIYGKEV